MSPTTKLSKLNWIFISGALIGALPLLIHLVAALFAQTEKMAFVIDVVLIGMVISTTGLMSGLKFMAFADTPAAHKKSGPVIFLTIITVIEICLFVAFYIAMLISPSNFEWTYLVVSLAACAVFSVAPYVIDVRYSLERY